MLWGPGGGPPERGRGGLARESRDSGRGCTSFRVETGFAYNGLLIDWSQAASRPCHSRPCSPRSECATSWATRDPGLGTLSLGL